MSSRGNERGQQGERGVLLHLSRRRMAVKKQESRQFAFSPEYVGTVLVYGHTSEVGRQYLVDSSSQLLFLPHLYLIRDMFDLPYEQGKPDEEGKIHELRLYQRLTTARQQICAVVGLNDEGQAEHVTFSHVDWQDHPSVHAAKRARMRVVKNE